MRLLKNKEQSDRMVFKLNSTEGIQQWAPPLWPHPEGRRVFTKNYLKEVTNKEVINNA